MTDEITDGVLSDGETEVWRYRLGGEPKGTPFGWAIALLDSTGYFSVVSDYGNYSYLWTNFGPSDFREFFVKLRADYVLRKIAVCDVYDGEETLRVVKAHILRERRDQMQSERQVGGSPGQYWTPETARREWNMAIESGMDVDELQFRQWCEDTTIEEPEQFHEHRPCGDAMGFVATTLPRLQGLIREHLARDEARARGLERTA